MPRKPRSPKGRVFKCNVSLSPETAARLEAYRCKHDRPRSWVVEKILSTANWEKLLP